MMKHFSETNYRNMIANNVITFNTTLKLNYFFG